MPQGKDHTSFRHNDFLNNPIFSFASMQTFKHSSSCKKHVEVCRVIKSERYSGSGEEKEPIEHVFRPAMEQIEIGPHQMKKCSVSIQRIHYIENAVFKGNTSISMKKAK